MLSSTALNNSYMTYVTKLFLRQVTLQAKPTYVYTFIALPRLGRKNNLLERAASAVVMSVSVNLQIP